MNDIDLSKMFDSMATDVGTGANPISTIYDIIPTYDPVQQKMLFELQFFIKKWGLDGLDGMIKEFTVLMAKNKNLSFFGSKSLRDMLAAYSQGELMGRISIRASNSEETSK